MVGQRNDHLCGPGYSYGTSSYGHSVEHLHTVLSVRREPVEIHSSDLTVLPRLGMDPRYKILTRHGPFFVAIISATI